VRRIHEGERLEESESLQEGRIMLHEAVGFCTVSERKGKNRSPNLSMKEKEK